MNEAQQMPLDNSIFGYSLGYSLSNYEKFKALEAPEQTILLQFAAKFEKEHGSHFMSPEELSQKLGGTSATWRQFLTLKPVRDYVTRKVQEDTEIMNRQALYRQAQKAAETGDTQAAKYITALAEANATATNQVHVILHYIPRPERRSPSVSRAD